MNYGGGVVVWEARDRVGLEECVASKGARYELKNGETTHFPLLLLQPARGQEPPRDTTPHTVTVRGG